VLRILKVPGSNLDTGMGYTETFSVYPSKLSWDSNMKQATIVSGSFQFFIHSHLIIQRYMTYTVGQVSLTPSLQASEDTAYVIEQISMAKFFSFLISI